MVIVLVYSILRRVHVDEPFARLQLTRLYAFGISLIVVQGEEME